MFRKIMVKQKNELFRYGAYLGLLTLFANQSLAQTFNWAAKIAGPESDLAKSIGVDNKGNTYVAGSYQQDCDFGNPSVTLASNGLSEAYIARYDSAGTLQWLTSFGGTQEDGVYKGKLIKEGQ